MGKKLKKSNTQKSARKQKKHNIKDSRKEKTSKKENKNKNKIENINTMSNKKNKEIQDNKNKSPQKPSKKTKELSQSNQSDISIISSNPQKNEPTSSIIIPTNLLSSSPKKSKPSKLFRPKTLLDYINSKSTGKQLPSLSSPKANLDIHKKPSNISKSSKTLSKPSLSFKNDNNSLQSNNPSTSNNNITSEYNKMLKPKVVFVNGKIQVEKPDVGLLNKQINDEIFKNAIPLEQDNINKRITSLSFKKMHHTSKWKKEETDNFYKALLIFGLDFSFLEIVLKPRTRFEIKKKYLKEEKINKNKIKKCLLLYSKLSSSNRNINQMMEIVKLFNGERREGNGEIGEMREKEIIERYGEILEGKNVGNGAIDVDKELDKINEEIGERDFKENDIRNYKGNKKVVIEGDKEDEEKEEEDDDDDESDEGDIKEEIIDNTKNVNIKSGSNANNSLKKNTPVVDEKENKRKKFVDDILNNFN